MLRDAGGMHLRDLDLRTPMTAVTAVLFLVSSGGIIVTTKGFEHIICNMLIIVGYTE